MKLVIVELEYVLLWAQFEGDLGVLSPPVLKLTLLIFLLLFIQNIISFRIENIN